MKRNIFTIKQTGIFIAVLLCILQGMTGNAQIINTVAGGATQGVTLGDGGPATAAQVSSPSAVAFDKAGNMYIAQYANSTVRKVSTSGIISTVAGGGGNTGDSGLATAAQLKGIYGIALDTANNLYIAEYNGHRIRKVNAITGIITTVAGIGTAGYNGDNIAATAAQLKNPTGIAFDTAGSMYIVDDGNNRIRKVDVVSGNISTVAGNGNAAFFGDGLAATSAQLKNPSGIAFDAMDNLYIADFNNNRIRKVDAVTGIINTVAGNGAAGYSGDGNAATTAQLKLPWSVTVDLAGNLYIGDYSNARVRKVDALSGKIGTVAGNGTGGYNGDNIAAITAAFVPRGIALDASGNLYIADYNNSRVRRVDAVSGIITTIAGITGNFVYTGNGGAAINSQIAAANIAFDHSGNMYIEDGNGNGNGTTVRKVAVGTGIISTVAGQAGVNGYYSGEGGLATAATLYGISGIALDRFDNLYIAMGTSGRVCKVDAVSNIITTVVGTGVAGYSGDGGLAIAAQIEPNDMAIDTFGNLYLTDVGSIRKIDAVSKIITTIAGTGVSGYSGDGGSATAAQIYPVWIALDMLGNIYMSDPNYHIRKIDVSGTINTVAGNGVYGYSGDGLLATDASFGSIADVALDAAGNIYVSTNGTFNGDNRVRKVDAISHIINTVAGNGIKGYSGDGGLATAAAVIPYGIAFDAADNLYIGHTGDGTSNTFQISRVREVIKPCSGVVAGAISHTGNDTFCVSGSSTLTLLGASAPAVFFGTNIKDTSSISYQWQAFTSETGWVKIGSDTSSYNTGNITATTAYRVIVTCKAAGISDTTDVDTLVVQQALTPLVSIAANTGSSICPGTSVVFTATPTNGGVNATYQWAKNGVIINGNSSNTYTDNTLNNNDSIVCTLTTGTGICVNTTTATSNTVKMSVTTAVNPSVSISADLGTAICAGTLVTFTASPAGGGASPAYQWTKNNVVINGISGDTYTDNGLNSNDYIQCTLTSSATCASPATANSNTLTMTVTPTVTPTINVAASTGDTACSGSTITFTATIANGGTTPVYEWTTNGTITGSGAVYTTSSLNNQDLVACTLISSAACATPDTLNSNVLTITIVPTVTPSVSISATTTSIKSGAVVIFTATPVNGGANTSYQWRINGINVPGATTSTYVTDSLADANSVTCMVHSDAICATPDSAISNAVVIHVSTGVRTVSSTSENLSLSPNPNKGTFNITGTIKDSKEVEITVLDVVGQVVYQDKVVVEHNQLQKQIQLPLTNASGVYLLRLKTDNGTSVKRFVMER